MRDSNIYRRGGIGRQEYRCTDFRKRDFASPEPRNYLSCPNILRILIETLTFYLGSDSCYEGMPKFIPFLTFPPLLISLILGSPVFVQFPSPYAIDGVSIRYGTGILDLVNLGLAFHSNKFPKPQSSS